MVIDTPGLRELNGRTPPRDLSRPSDTENCRTMPIHQLPSTGTNQAARCKQLWAKEFLPRIDWIAGANSSANTSFFYEKWTPKLAPRKRSVLK